jgi:hypothetical protein
VVELASLDSLNCPVDKLYCLRTTLDLILAELKGAIVDAHSVLSSEYCVTYFYTFVKHEQYAVHFCNGLAYFLFPCRRQSAANTRDRWLDSSFGNSHYTSETSAYGIQFVLYGKFSVDLITQRRHQVISLGWVSSVDVSTWMGLLLTKPSHSCTLSHEHPLVSVAVIFVPTFEYLSFGSPSGS